MASQGTKGFYPMKTSGWEEMQGNRAILRLPAGTSCSEICLINTSNRCGSKGSRPGEGPVQGFLLGWSPPECLVGYVSLSFRRLSAEDSSGPGHHVPLSTRTPTADGPTPWFFLSVFLFRTSHTSRRFHPRANASFFRETQKAE